MSSKLILVPFTDYFAAPTDTDAANAVGVNDPRDLGFATVYAKNIDPVILLGRLEAIMTAATLDEVQQRDRHGRPAAPPDGDILIINVTDSLRDAMARVKPDQLHSIAAEWSAVEEFSGLFPVDLLVLFLRQLAELATTARTANQHLYCRWSL